MFISADIISFSKRYYAINEILHPVYYILKIIINFHWKLFSPRFVIEYTVYINIKNSRWIKSYL